MIKKLLIFSLLLSSPLIAAPSSLGGGKAGVIVINNRVLAHVNGKAITVLDLMKKMDMLFLKQFPEYTSSSEARFQYYQVNWRQVLQELIDKELILADAAENKIPITAGDVRQEMERLFGPNIIANLDSIGLSFDEAFKIVQGDILLRRMMAIRVNSKVVRNVTPQVIREAYDDFASKNIKKETWHYQVATIRNNDPASAKKAADAAISKLNEGHILLLELPKVMKDQNLLEKSTISITDPLYHTDEDLADAIKEELKKLTPETYSAPLLQKSRSDKSHLYRIIYLIEKVPAGKIPYAEIENQLKDELYDKAMQVESESYIKKLRSKYSVELFEVAENLPESSQPFLLR